MRLKTSAASSKGADVAGGSDGNQGHALSSLLTSEVKFTIPFMAPSVNALHNVLYGQRRVELKPEVRLFRNEAKSYVPRMKLQSDSLIHADLTFYYKHLYANGKLKRLDTHNCVKVILDLIAEKVGFDDSRIKSGSWSSVDSNDEKIEIVMRELHV